MQGNAHSPRLSEHPQPALRVIREGFPDRPAFGTAVSEALMLRVAAGELPSTLRLHRPARELAFSKHDRASAGYDAAVGAARAAGFEPVLRIAGGRAAVFHEGTLAIAWAIPDPRPARGTHERFAVLAEVIAGALRRLGVDARIGEVAGEYCPGAWSVNAGGRVKLAGIGQRIVAGGAHLGAVVVVNDAPLVRAALEPVYRALALEWDPATAAAVEDEAPGASLEAIEDAVLAELAARFELTPASLDSATLERATTLEPEHVAMR